jgi:hypothetical protein
MSDAVKGMFGGAFIGGIIGLWACMYVLGDATLAFPGDTILAGAVIGAFGGAVWGEDFMDWLSHIFRALR